MSRVVTAREIVEKNDILGRKHISVIGMEEDEIIPITYHLTPRYMIPYEKLLLATVGEDDKVIVDESNIFDYNNLTDGEYVGNMFNAQERDPLCSCGNRLTSDGLDIWCNNRECGLTILARLERLAACQFFEANSWVFPLGNGAILSGDCLERPFELILNPNTWNRPTWPMQRIMLDKNTDRVSLATFLVQNLFQAFIDSSGLRIHGYSAEYKTLGRFFEMMDQIVFRRDYDSNIQNLFIKRFLWSLSIPGLTEDIIEKMVVAEAGFGMIDEVFLPYVSYLTNSAYLQEDLGVERIVADWIVREFYLRRHEFFDIFSAYSTSKDLIDIFNNMNIAKRNLDEVFSILKLE